MRLAPAAALLSLIPVVLGAQHALTTGGSYDAAVPTPAAVLGYEVGSRFTPHHMIMRYAERVAAASPRITLDTVARTFEGRESLLIIATSAANHGRLDQIRANAQRLADPRDASAGELALASRIPSIAWLGYTVHGGEASGTEAALALLYQLAAGTDAETRLILDSTIVLIDPVQNPDGHERHVQDVLRMRPMCEACFEHGVPTTPGTMVHQGSWPGPRTSHYNFDLNRDWFIHSHPETRGRVATFHAWAPHVAVDLHEMGSSSSYFFAPPMEPVNKNVHASILKWWDIYAVANAAAFDRNGWAYFRREGYDEFYPGYGVSWPILTGAVGMTYEQASSSGGAIRRSDGTVLTLTDAASHHYAAAWATILTTARLRDSRVRDYLEFRRSAVSDGERAALRAVVIERDAYGRADSLAQRLIGNGIEVHRLRADADLRGAMEYGATAPRDARAPAGSYVVDLAQPQGRLARALLEPDAQLDSSFIRGELESRRTGQSDRFYDVTAWSLPYLYRVRAWGTRTAVGSLELVRDMPAAMAAAPPQARFAYAFAPGSETSLRMLAGLLRDSVRVRLAQRGFRAGNDRFPQGAFIALVSANDARVHDVVRRNVAASGARVVALNSSMVDEGTDLGSNSVMPLRMPRVAIAGGGGVNGNSFGFARYTMEQRLAYPVTPVAVASLAGSVLNEFDVLILPSAGGGQFSRELGDAGRDRLAQWVRAGGVVITLQGATAWATQEDSRLSRVRAWRDTTRRAADAGAPLPASVPGAIARVLADTLSPLMTGVRDVEFPVLVSGNDVYVTPRDVRPGEVVARFGPESRLRLAGYFWPESPARIAGSPWLWTESVGSGRVIAFAGDPNFRDMWRGLLPLFANAVLLGSSF
ncbi:MAG: M14 family zinc carboxypeptidase [Gemmatimonadaceae bacterium]